MKYVQNLERVLRDLVTQNADLQSRVQRKDRELAQKVCSLLFLCKSVVVSVVEFTFAIKPRC